MPEIDQKYIQNKFIEYCKVNTRSDEQKYSGADDCRSS